MSQPDVQVEYWDETLKEANFKHSWLAEDDFLLGIDSEGSTLKLWAVLGYGNDATELVFDGVERLTADPELLSGESIMVSGAKFTKSDDHCRLVIHEMYGTREHDRTTRKPVPVLEVVFKKCLYRDVKTLNFHGVIYHGYEPYPAKRAAATIGVFLLLLALIFFWAYWSNNH